ncbi:TMV resistance protein N-like [Pistacia vera]|uniref:TMV resistance protein N-like n=1 Tax=Pistacia vera TaxID=55513 RepID=UPI001263D63C|nr:TMV resistance protein N-like [Pistacia vera]
MASSSSSSSIILQSKYEVFLSFRGEDTRDTFTSHLFAALCQKQIQTFIDDDRLKKGNDISPALTKAIKESKIAIVVFSKNYAFSKWCLDELVEIIECKKMNGQIVIPVFYHVKPSDVRNQTGSFEDAFRGHEQSLKVMPAKVQRWRAALTEASNLCGMDSTVIKPESKLLAEIIKEILKQLNEVSPSSDCEGLVGIESRIDDIKSLLHTELPDFRIIGMWGMGGIGKTTIAGLVFNQLCSKFEGCFFIANVREESKRCGLVHVRNQGLSQILEENLKTGSPAIPAPVRRRLQRKKVLIVIDDVHDLGQLEVLIGGLPQFGPGSRVIITARDKQVLCSYRVNHIYEVKRLKDNEALQLFCNYAFKTNHPDLDLKELSKRITDYANGNPLALKVLGSSLYQKSKQRWEEALCELKKNFNPTIYNVLRVSYNGLNVEQKSIFLDIACFFKGWSINLVTDILNSCYSFSQLGA